MKITRDPPWPPRIAAGAAVLLSAIGCHAPPPAADALASVASIRGSDDGIEYRVDGEPIDVADDAIEPLDAAHAVRLALRHDPELQAKLARVRAALADARQARLLPNPVLSVAFRFPEAGGRADIDAGLSADLLALLWSPQRVGAADRRLRAACAEAVVVALDAIAAVEERLVRVRASEAEGQVLDERLRLVGRLVDLARTRAEAGEGSRLDVLALDAERVEVESEQIDLRARQTEHRLALARQIGRPSAAIDWTVPPLASERSPAADLYDEHSLIARALARRPEIAAGRWELAALGDEAALARWPWAEGGAVGVDAEREDAWAVGPGASVPLPIFDVGQARRERANARVIESRHQLTRVGRQVVEDVRQAMAARASAMEALAKIQGELLPLATRRRDQAEAQYRAGEADVSALLQAEHQVLRAASKRIEAARNIALAEVRLRRAVGGDVANGRPATRLAPTNASTRSSVSAGERSP